MKEANPFPDKKQPMVDYGQISQYLEDGRLQINEWKVGQKEATWIPQAEHPHLPIGILLMTDTHFGSTSVDTDLINQHLGIVEHTENFFLVHNGDQTDNFSSFKHASGMSENPIPPGLQMRTWANEMLRLDAKGKIGAVGYGNHDDFTFDSSQIDPYDAYYGQLSCPLLTQGGLVRIMVGGQKYELAMAHTYWGNSKLNPTNRNKRFMEHEWPNSDITFLGHTHQHEALHFERGGKDRIAVVGGAYKDQDSWAAKRGIGGRAGSPGVMVFLWPDQRKMQLYNDVKHAQEVMDMAILLDQYTGKRR